MPTRISNLGPKFFGIGLSRTGTSSLSEALQILGYRTVHWKAPHQRRLANLEECYLFDAVTDINAAFMFETLFHIFPGSRFIYTTRPVEAWIASIHRHYQAANPADMLASLAEKNVRLTGEPMEHEKDSILFHAIHHGLYGNCESWHEAWENHERRISRFFRGREDRLLRYDVRHGWEPLCRFVGRPVPTKAFPSVTWKPPPGLGSLDTRG